MQIPSRVSAQGQQRLPDSSRMLQERAAQLSDAKRDKKQAEMSLCESEEARCKEREASKQQHAEDEGKIAALIHRGS